MSWTARPETTGYWKREWVEVIDRLPSNVQLLGCVRGYDIAATPEPDAMSVNKNPDYTACTLLGKDTTGTYYIIHADRYRRRPNEVLQSIITQSQIDGIDVPVAIPRDGGAGGKFAHQHMVDQLSMHGIIVKTDVMSGHSGKLQRFLPFAQICEAGLVKMVRGDWNEIFCEELEEFDPNTRSSKHDDITDSVSTAFKILGRAHSFQPVVMPVLTRPSAMPF